MLFCNRNGKIWPFWTNDMDCDILEVHDQHVTCLVKHVEHKEKYMISCIYSKCRDHLRRPLWERLFHFSDMNLPW